MSAKSVDEQLNILLRGVAQVETLAELRHKLERSLATGRPLRVKYGIDPTGFDVHLGHTVPLRKLRRFQELGHTAVLIIGTATAAVGDPSGRDESRKGLSPAQIEANARTYLEQIQKVILSSNLEVRPNSEWFHRWGFAEVLKLLGKTTVQRMLERDDFRKRYHELKMPIYLHECLYPLMQGQDSVEIQADVELGGTEQLYNLMVGRDLQRDAGQEPQVCITMPILRGTDGEKKMGKSVGNYIGVNEPAKEQFGKTLSIPDHLMKEWFELLTDRSASEIEALLTGHPMEAKKQLAMDIVTFYHGHEAAIAARKDWEAQFTARVDPEHIEEVTVPAAEIVDGQISAVNLIVLTKLAASKSEARRKIEEGAFNYGPSRTKPADAKATVPIQDGLVVRLGRKIIRVRLGQ